jgi:hypothetical protein
MPPPLRPCLPTWSYMLRFSALESTSYASDTCR